MTDKNYPKIFQTEYALRENIDEIMARTGLTYREVRDCIVFWIIDGSKYGVRLRDDGEHRLWIENVEQK